MRNDDEQHIRWKQYCDMMQAMEFGIPTQRTELDLPMADDIKINDLGPVMRAVGNSIELVPMNFSFPPSSPRGGPVFNFRSEGRNFEKSNRCLIPAVAQRGCRASFRATYTPNVECTMMRWSTSTISLSLR